MSASKNRDLLEAVTESSQSNNTTLCRASRGGKQNPSRVKSCSRDRGRKISCQLATLVEMSGTEMRAKQLFASCCVIAVAVAAGQDSDFDTELLAYEGQSFEEREEQGEWLRADLTEFLHHLFPLVSEFMRNNDLDPLGIRDIRRSFWMLFLVLPGTCFELTYSFPSGLLYYLSELERNDTLIVTYRDKTLNIDASIALDSVLLSCDYFVKLLFLRQYGIIRAEATSLWLRIRVDFDMLRGSFALKDLKLNRIESIKVSMLCGNLMGRFTTLVTNIAISTIKKTLIETVEKEAAIMVREHLEWINGDMFPWNVLRLFITI